RAGGNRAGGNPIPHRRAPRGLRRRLIEALAALAAAGRRSDLTPAGLPEVGREWRVGGSGKDGQADAPADDGGALDCLGVGKILQIPLAETYDERAQVGVLEHVCAGIAG